MVFVHECLITTVNGNVEAKGLFTFLYVFIICVSVGTRFLTRFEFIYAVDSLLFLSGSTFDSLNHFSLGSGRLLSCSVNHLGFDSSLILCPRV